jgi:hypothetical protein
MPGYVSRAQASVKGSLCGGACLGYARVCVQGASISYECTMQRSLFRICQGMCTVRMHSAKSALCRGACLGYARICVQGASISYECTVRRSLFRICQGMCSGRKHQLRVHCAEELGWPILGDRLYGGSESPEEATLLRKAAAALALRAPKAEPKSSLLSTRKGQQILLHCRR